jgi:hypothetical protein
MPWVVKKKYQYQAVIIDDRAHLDDPEFLSVLNEEGAKGWKRSEELPKGSSKLVVLLERELVQEE